MSISPLQSLLGKRETEEERLKREEEERKKKEEEARRKAEEEAKRKAKEEAERKAKEEAERKEPVKTEEKKYVKATTEEKTKFEFSRDQLEEEERKEFDALVEKYKDKPNAYIRAVTEWERMGRTEGVTSVEEKEEEILTPVEERTPSVEPEETIEERLKAVESEETDVPIKPKGGVYLEFQENIDGIDYYYSPDKSQSMTVHTVTHETEDGKWANMPSILKYGYWVGGEITDKKEREIYDYWQNEDPSKIELFDSREEAEQAAKDKSASHHELGLSRNVISDPDEGLFELGTRLERTTTGNLLRLAKSSGIALFDRDRNIQQVIKDQEQERLREVYAYMEKKYGKDFKGREGELEVLAGRLTTAFADPITFFLPWAKAAKMGKLAATGMGAGVGVADMALYDLAAHGKVYGDSLLFAGAVGGGTSLVGKVVVDKIRKTRMTKAPENKKINVGKDEKGNKIVKETKIKDEEIPLLSLKEADNLEDATVQFLKEDKYASILDRLGGETAIMPYITKNLDTAYNVKKQARKLEVAYALQKKEGVQTTLPGLEGGDIISKQKIGAWRRKAKKADADISKQWDNVVAVAEGRAELTDGVITYMAKNKTLTDNVLTSILQEATRPLTGAGMGWLTGQGVQYFQSEVDPDSNLVRNFTMAGFAFGMIQKRVEANPYLTKSAKEKAFGITRNASAIALHNFLKIITAGTAASKGIAHGGPVEAVTRLLFHVQGGAGKKSMNGAEGIADHLVVEWMNRASKSMNGSSLEQRKAAWYLVRGLDKTPEEAAKRFNLTSPKDINNIKVLRENITTFMDEYSNKYVRGAGKEFEDIPNYGLPQAYDFDAIIKDISQTRKVEGSNFWKAMNAAVKIEFNNAISQVKTKSGSKAADKYTRERTNAIVDSIVNSQKRAIDIDELIDHTVRSKKKKKGTYENRSQTGIPLLDNFDRQRQIKKPEAVRAISDFLQQDPQKILFDFIDDSVRGIEFGRAMGIRTVTSGNKKYRVFENLKLAKNKLKDQYQKGEISLKEYENKKKFINKQVNGYFRTVDVDSTVNEKVRAGFSVLTFLSNASMLTRSGITQLADLTQPFQNSSQFASVRTLARMYINKEDFAKELGYSTYGNSLRGVDPKSIWNRERFAFTQAGEGGSNAVVKGEFMSANIQRRTANWTRNFFRFNQMAPMTDVMARFNFNTGIEEAFHIAKRYAGTNLGSKGKYKKIFNHLQRLGLSEKDLVKINKFNDLDKAMKSTSVGAILTRAGRNSKEFNTLQATSGNRLHFAQSHRPEYRTMGLFLSWAQAKTAQMNSLIKRVEDGDVALAIKTLTGLTVLGGIRELQIAFSPAVDYYEEKAPERFSKLWWTEAARIGGLQPWVVEKMTRTFSLGSGSDPLDNLTPVVAWLEDFIQMFPKVAREFSAKDYEGAIVEAIKPIPVADELNLLLGTLQKGEKALLYENLPNDDIARRRLDPTESSPGFMQGFFEGGEVSIDNPVPNTVEDPSERINPYTQMPYDQEMERHGAKGGGGVMVSISPISEKQVGKIQRILAKRKDKYLGGKVAV